MDFLCRINIQSGFPQYSKHEEHTVLSVAGRQDFLVARHCASILCMSEPHFPIWGVEGTGG